MAANNLSKQELAKAARAQDASIARRTHREYGIPEHLTPVITHNSLRRENIRDSMIKQVKDNFPLEVGNHRIEIEDAWVDPSDVTPTMEREAILKQQSLHEKLLGNVVIKDAEGNVIDRKENHVLAKIPYLTDDGVCYINGTAYGPRSQLRTRAGVFTRKRSNEEIEASFNLSKGANFRLSMEPESGRLNFELGTSKIPLYPVLRGLGYTHDAIAQKWGEEIASQNASYDKNRGKHIQSLYSKLIPEYKQSDADSEDHKIMKLKEYFDNTRMEPEVNARTLGDAHDRVTPKALVDASHKLLRVFRGEEKTDDRDALPFQRLHGVEDFFAERMKLDMHDVKQAIGTKLRFSRGKPATVARLLPTNTFGKGINTFVTTSSIFTTPTGINPLEGYDLGSTITRLGEGAIGSERAIPMEARRLHASHLGFIGPLRTPESSRAGIDIRATLFLTRDNQGRMYTPLYDLKDRKMVYKSAEELVDEPIAFPEQDTQTGNIDVLHNGVVQKLKPGQVRYQVPHPSAMYSIGANLIPAVESVQGNRGLMGSKTVTQALPLVNADSPLVQIQSAAPEVHETYEKQMAHLIEATSPANGKVKAVDNDFIHVDGEDGVSYRVPYKQNHPSAKTRLHQTPMVKAGDEVKLDQILTKSNFTNGKELTLGKNLSTAYIADKGYNSDDAVSISQTAAQKLTSEHMYTKRFQEDDTTKIGTRPHASHCPGVFTRDQYAKVDESTGIAKKGTILKYGDPVIVAIRKTTPSAEDRMLGRLHKSLVRSYTDVSTVWDKHVDGEVVETSKNGKSIAVTILTKEPAKLGDKISGLHGNKGVIGRIVPDSDMLKDEKGNTIDMLYTSAGVISRINPGQVVVSALGKAALAQGKEKHVLRQFDMYEKNNVHLARRELEKAGLNPNGKETVTDPVTGRKIPNIFVGQNYILKLAKTTDTNFAARNTGGYDSVEQPTKGGSTAAKSAGNMEVNALLAHNARGYLSDITNIKSQQNNEYWRAVQLGQPPPTPNKNFVFTKFLGMLKGSGINIDEKNDEIAMAPLTDSDIERMSSGEIVNAKRLKAKNLQPETGGLFDPAATGGVSGKRWSHVELGEPLVNPLFFEPTRRLLGKTQKEMMEMIRNTDGNKIKEQLNQIDVKAQIVEAQQQARTSKGVQRDEAVKKFKFLTALDRLGVKPGDVYTLSKFPVIPPNMRPIIPSGRGDNAMIVDDANFLYRDVILSKEKLKELKDLDLPPEFVGPERQQLYNALSATIGLSDPVSPQSQSRKAKGFLKNIAGTSPKYGFFQSKVIKRKTDLSGSATVALNPKLGVDEIELPEDIAWTTYQPFVMKRLVESGMSRTQAMDEVEKRSNLAYKSLQNEVNHRPIVINRAPSLHRFNMLGVFPRLTKGKTVRVNPYLTEPMNMDFDGDVAMLSLPVTEEGRKDVLNMRLSKQLFSDKKRGDLLIAPRHEAIFGWSKATDQPQSTEGTAKKFKNLAEAMAAYQRGDLKATDLVDIQDSK